MSETQPCSKEAKYLCKKIQSHHLPKIFSMCYKRINSQVIYKFLILIILSLFICSNTYAQKFFNSVLTKYPNAVVINMYNDVLSKIDISEDLQIKLASMYVLRDSLIFKQLSSPSKSINSIRYGDSLLYSIEIKFKKLLDSLKRREYFLKVERTRLVNFPIVQDTIYMDIQMDSQFGLALALYEKFRLKPKQKDDLLYYATILKQKENYYKQNIDSGYFDKAAFESENMPKVLTEQEYNGLLSIKNKVIAETNSRNNWYDLKKTNQVPLVGREDTLFQLKMYHLLKATIWDKFAHMPQLRNTMMLNVMPPYILQKAWATKTETDNQLKKYSW